MSAPTADQYLAALAADIDYHESPKGSNCNRYSKALGRGCEKWCMDFLVAKAHEQHLPLPSDTASTPVMLVAFRHAGRASAAPARGAFAFFDFPDKTTGVQHVGCVESWTAGSITTIDGNTGVASQDNGGEVARRTRQRGFVVAYGLPVYAGTPSPAPVPPQEDDMAYAAPIIVDEVWPGATLVALPDNIDKSHAGQVRWRWVLSQTTLDTLKADKLVLDAPAQKRSLAYVNATLKTGTNIG